MKAGADVPEMKRDAPAEIRAGSSCVSHDARQAAYRKRQEEDRIRQLQERGLPPLPVISTIPGIHRWRRALCAAATLMTLVAEEMEAYYDARTDQWRDSDRGEEFAERLAATAEARDSVTDLRTA
jgi:hypothetical protein